MTSDVNKTKVAVAAGKAKEATPKVRLNSVQIKLDEPIIVDGAKIDVLTMRRPKVRDQKNAHAICEGDTVKMEMVLFTNLCDLPIDAWDDLYWDQYIKLQEAYTNFLA